MALRGGSGDALLRRHTRPFVVLQREPLWCSTIEQSSSEAYGFRRCRRQCTRSRVWVSVLTLLLPRSLAPLGSSSRPLICPTGPTSHHEEPRYSRHAVDTFGDTWRVIVEWDPAKAAGNRRKHAVDFREALTALEDPLSTTYPDPEHSVDERRFVTIGASARGRVLVVAHWTAAQRLASSARGEPPRASAGSMKKASSRTPGDDLRPEYDFTSMKGGVRGKYYRRFGAGTNIVRLEPALAKAFPTDEAANEALRTVVRASRTLRRATTPPQKRTKRKRS
jgi:uncharacterized DUF497 family protein